MSMITRNSVFRSLVVALAAVGIATSFWSAAMAQSHPQEVLDLVAAHNALAMKIRPLRDRIAAAEQDNAETVFNPEGAPVRAKVAAAADQGTSQSESRVTERLRHKDRAVAMDKENLMARLTTLETKARKERERINRPNFGVGLDARAMADAQKKLRDLQREFAVIEREAGNPVSP